MAFEETAVANRLHLVAALWLFITHAALATTDPRFDFVLLNGRVIDGTGSPWYRADIGIRDGHIAAIGQLVSAPARRRIDVRGRIIAPGFIDMLGQSELTILVDPRLPSKIYQGITTEITGEGTSIAPRIGSAAVEMRPELERLHLTADWSDFSQYFGRLERQGIGINIGSYVGATSVREAIIGEDNRTPSEEELERMRHLVRVAMEQGAIGLSTALEYAPAPYATTDELIALAREASRFGGVYATHLRSQGDAIMAALEESFRIGRDASVPVEIWHVKVAGKANWGRMPDVIAAIERARRSGVDVAADTYAYTAWFNDLSAFVPPWAHEGGTARMLERLKDPTVRARIRKDMETPSPQWENEWSEITGPQDIVIGVTHSPQLKSLQGKTIKDIATARHADPLDTLLDILIQDNGVTQCAVFAMDESDVALALIQPWTSVDNDSPGTTPEGLLGESHPHPRAYGAFPRILRKYVREEHKLSLEDAVHKFSALPAARTRLEDRGVIKVGLCADLVVFDPDTVSDRSTYAEPNQLATGMQWVFVNGVPVIDDGDMTGALPGRVLRGPGYRPAAMDRLGGPSRHVRGALVSQAAERSGELLHR